MGEEMYCNFAYASTTFSKVICNSYGKVQTNDVAVDVLIGGIRKCLCEVQEGMYAKKKSISFIWTC